MKDPDNIKKLTLTKNSHSTYSNGVHNLDNWDNAQIKDVLGDQEKISSQRKFDYIQNHYKDKEARVEKQIASAKVDASSSSDGLDLELPTSAQQDNTENDAVETKKAFWDRDS